MSREKQIEEMAKDLAETYADDCEAWHCGGCQYEKYEKGYFCSIIIQAEKMTAKGYRKASDVAREIIDILKFAGIDEWRYPVIAELKKKYTEVDDDASI